MRGREQSGIPLPLMIRDVLDLKTPLPSVERAHSMPILTFPQPPSLPRAAWDILRNDGA